MFIGSPDSADVPIQGSDVARDLMKMQKWTSQGHWKSVLICIKCLLLWLLISLCNDLTRDKSCFQTWNDLKGLYVRSQMSRSVAVDILQTVPYKLWVMSQWTLVSRRQTQNRKRLMTMKKRRHARVGRRQSGQLGKTTRLESFQRRGLVPVSMYCQGKNVISVIYVLYPAPPLAWMLHRFLCCCEHDWPVKGRVRRKSRIQLCRHFLFLVYFWKSA